MKPHIYEVAVGNEVPAEFHGKEIALTRATTIEEAVASGQFESNDAIMASATSQWLIGARALIRAELGRKPKDPKVGFTADDPAPTLESAAAAGNKYQVKTPGERQPAKPKTEKGIARSASTDAGNKLFTRYRDDAKFTTRVDAMDKVTENDEDKIINPVAYTAWLKVNPAPAK